jgi:predicted  nucleic acid-binding Zn-ribbon protein
MAEISLKDIRDAVRGEIKPFNKRLDDINRTVEGLSTKQELKKLDVKADKTSVIVANLVEDFHEVPKLLKQIREMQIAQNNVLDTIVKSTKDWREEIIVMNSKLEKY